ncbi:MAG: ABC-type transport auxiliary lipoprotein family protein [Campylobacterales bacterium]
MKAIYTTLLILGALLLSGCWTKTPPTARYDLGTIDQQPRFTCQSAPLKLAYTTAAPPYNSDRLIYRDADGKIISYTYSRWAAPLPQMVDEFALLMLRQACPSSTIIAPQMEMATSDKLMLRLINIHRQGGEKEEAIVTIEITLKQKDGQFSQKTFTVRHPIDQPDKTSSTVNALRLALHQALLEGLSWALGQNHPHHH